MKLKNYAAGKWVEGEGAGTILHNAINGNEIAEATSKGLDFAGMLAFARKTGGPKLRKMTFHERALMLKSLALYLTAKKGDFYATSAFTGATKADSWIDIDGGIGNLFVYASKGRRELPNETFYVDGKAEMLSKNGSFIGHHICVPMEGVAIHINAFNFPVWGMLEKIAVNFLAGMPAIVKPATVTSYLTEHVTREIIASGILPEGALQLICGSAGDILQHVNEQDVVTFTGSASTGRMLKASPSILENSVRFNMEADSLNCSILGPDAKPNTEEFKLFIKEVSREMTVKAGQKCTAIRRIIVHESVTDEVIKAVSERLKTNVIGDPAVEGVRMGPLASKEQVTDVKAKVKELLQTCEIAYGNLDNFEVSGADKNKGYFMPSVLLHSKQPFEKSGAHSIEAFGPVSTIMSYKTNDEAAELAKLGRGSLVGSVFTADDNFAKEIILGAACMHGRMIIVNAQCAGESTGHGSPMPHLVHGGPGRAGGGEEMGGIRGVFHYMQRTAIQGSPTTLTKITNVYQNGSKQKTDTVHPFRKYYEELEIGDTLVTATHTVSEEDILNFAELSGDKFYAHLQPESLEGTIFKRTVAHGYFVLSRAAGLFVDAPKGPVLLNYGLDECRFTKPIYPGMTIGVRFTCKEKIANDKPLLAANGKEVKVGIVKWLVDIYDASSDEIRAKYEVDISRGDTVGIATILTMVARKE
jgi:oxepin-CoA hydrolase/3-oxo-5,6-dehydrosuberyl-CoA semialdehyde dehydrogenase